MQSISSALQNLQPGFADPLPHLSRWYFFADPSPFIRSQSDKKLKTVPIITFFARITDAYQNSADTDYLY